MQTPLELEGSEHDIFWLAEKNKNEGIPFPKLYMWCGTEDHLFKANVEYHELLTKLGVEHTFETSEGNHTWRWWDLHILPALNHILSE